MIGNPVWGVMLDRFGLRAGMFSAVSFWTLASAAHAFAGGLWSFASARALLGFGEGATFPGGLRTATQTLPKGLQSRGIAVAYSGGSLGAIVTPLLVTPIALRYCGGASTSTGAVGILWLAIWTLVSRRLPRHEPEPKAKTEFPKMNDRRLWGFMCAYALGAQPLGFVLYGAAIYLSRYAGFPRRTWERSCGYPRSVGKSGTSFGDGSQTELEDSSPRSFSALRLSLPLIAVPEAPTVGLVMAGFFFAMFVGSGFIILSSRARDAGVPSIAVGIHSGRGGRVVVRSGRVGDAGVRSAVRSWALRSGFPSGCRFSYRRLSGLANLNRKPP